MFTFLTAWFFMTDPYQMWTNKEQKIEEYEEEVYEVVTIEDGPSGGGEPVPVPKQTNTKIVSIEDYKKRKIA